jgi:guanine nucleotide-binding protein G(I)/G(S)/G(T) subunit beta-1
MSIQDQIDDLQARIKDMREDAIGSYAETMVQETFQNSGGVLIPSAKFGVRSVLKGHFGKVYALQWAADSRRMVSASQDGKLILWDSKSGNKLNLIDLRSSWVMTCAYSPQMDMVACGGLDNICSVYKTPVNMFDPMPSDSKPIELAHHEGYISCARFTPSNKKIITASGDSTCVLWDIEQKKELRQFSEHEADVMSVALMEEKSDNLFVSGSCDVASILWDSRNKEPVAKFYGFHESDINTVDTVPGANLFVTGSDDSCCIIYDTRNCAVPLNIINSGKVLDGVASVAFSKSARFVFASYDGVDVLGWDTMGSYPNDPMAQLAPSVDHRTSCVGIPDDGACIGTGSWDNMLRVYA